MPGSVDDLTEDHGEFTALVTPNAGSVVMTVQLACPVGGPFPMMYSGVNGRQQTWTYQFPMMPPPMPTLPPGDYCATAVFQSGPDTASYDCHV
jgi:hypothetical protein